MSAKLFSRNGAFVWAPRGVELKGLVVGDFAQFYDPNASDVVRNIDFFDKDQLLAEPNPTPNASASTNYRFNELTWWPKCSEEHPQGVIGCGTENGTVVIFDAHKLANENRLEILSARRDHHGQVLTIDTACDASYLASGGSQGDILLWDPTNLKQPFSPGSSHSQDQVKSIRWNRTSGSLFGSITSKNLSLWDLRSSGTPVLVMAEVPSCDWSSLSWHPTDANYLMVGSQSPNCSVIHKYDIRFSVNPSTVYRHHTEGVTSLDWHKRDSRLLMSSGCNGQVFIWSHETSEVLGGVGNLQNDWIRSVKWNEEEPDQFAIQYYRNSIQMGSLTTLGTPQPGVEVLAPRVAEHLVPEWRQAPSISSSVALGAHMVTVAKNYDPETKQWNQNVEMETFQIKTGKDVGAAKMDKYLEVRIQKRDLGWYLHDRANKDDITSESPEDVAVERMLWSILLALIDGKGRSKLLALLGFSKDDDDEVFEQAPPTTSNSTTAPTATDTNSRSVISSTSSTGTEISTSTTETVHLEPSVLEKCVGVAIWDQLGVAGWELLHCVLRKDHLPAIRILMDSSQHVAAMMYAAKNSPEHMSMVLKNFNNASSNPHTFSTLILALSDTSSEDPQRRHHHHHNSGDYRTHIDGILKSFPDEKWRELLGVIIAQEVTHEEIRAGAKHLGARWLEMGKPLRACICFILGGDVDRLLKANSMFPMADRLIQALVLHNYTKKRDLPKGLDKLLLSYSEELMANGDTLTAWNMLKGIGNISDELQIQQWTVWNVAGKEQGTGDMAPFPLYDIQMAKPVEKESPNQSRPPTAQAPRRDVMRPNPSMDYSQYQPVRTQPSPPPMNPINHVYNNGAMPPPPTHQSAPPMNPNIAPMPPSSTFYQTPQPAMPPNMPPPKPAVPMTAGWNDPPPGMLAARQTPPTVAKPNVMEMTWKPVEVAPAPGGMMAPIQRNAPNAMYLGQQMQGMSIQTPPSTAASSSVLSSPALSSQAPPTAPQAPPPIQLSPEDEKILEPFYKFLDSVLENAQTQAKIVKANELKKRIQLNLEPRLAENRLTDLTKHHLNNMGHFLSKQQYWEAKSVINQMAQNSGDFVEVSTFLPALKSLFALTH